MMELARQYVIRNFPTTPVRGADETFREFETNGKVQTKFWGTYEYAGGQIWDQDLTPSVRRYFHSWLFMTNWVTLGLMDDHALDVSAKVAENWIQKFGNSRKGDDNFKKAYHGEGTAQRGKVALKLHYALTNSGNKSHSALYLLERTLEKTAELLHSEEFFTGLDNHGMFQSLALRDVASYATWIPCNLRSSMLEVANKRLLEYFTIGFTSEGVHIEHSPSYHLMVLRDVKEHLQFLSCTHSKGSDVLERILVSGTNHTIHTILPSGVFLPLSDTQQKSLQGKHNNVTNDSALDFAVSLGVQGAQPSTRTLSEPESGYFFHRTSWGSTDARYLAFVAAYNGDYHKHSDDLHVYLWDRGHEILSESGPFGYNSKDPYVRYGYSQWAHNNVVVDEMSLPRVDQKFDAVGISKVGTQSDILTVQGYNSRHKGVEHIRTLEFNDSLSHLQIIDDLLSNADHTYTLNWNIGPTVDVQIAGNIVIGRIKRQIVFILSVYSESQIEISHVKGRAGRRPLEWRFPKMNSMVPSSLLSFTTKAKNVRFVTKLEILEAVGADDSEGAFEAPALARSVPAENQLQPILPHVVGSRISLSSLDTGITHGVVKLYSKRGLQGESRGPLSEMIWSSLEPGAYRFRIFPKVPGFYYRPYTTAWFEIR